MNPRRVLQLGTYPIQPSIHGGQRRTQALHAAYLRNNIEAQYACIYNPRSYRGNAGPFAFRIGAATQKAIRESGWLEDLLLGRCLEYEPQIRKAFVRMWHTFRPEVVQLEQPYLWPSIQYLFREKLVEPIPIIASTQNIEWQMKEEIYRRFFCAEEAATLAQKLREMETELTRAAELVLAVSASDAQHFEAMGAKRTLLVRNGGEFPQVSPRKVSWWQKRLLGGRIRRYVVLVSSCHPPNLWGFEQMLGAHLEYLPPDAQLVVAGGITQLLAAHPNYHRQSDNRWRLFPIRWTLSNEELAALIHLSRGVLLPITHGGGSNLKTVEALMSGRPVIGTPYAFRSFEDFSSLSRVQVCKQPQDFRIAVRELLLAPPHTAEADSREQLQPLTWSAIGDRFVAQLGETHRPQIVGSGKEVA
jgi:glycosyltransferase involved in cell wall biosynthesis